MKLGTKIFGLVTFSFLAVAALVGIQPKGIEATRAGEGYKYSTHGAEYTLVDQIVGLDLSEEGDITSRWGRQEDPFTVVYKNGINYCAAGQPVNTTVSSGSYHTKLGITMVTPSADWFNMMLRQNSGELTQAADGQIDIGLRNGFELFTGDNGFQVFYNENNERTPIGWFAYDDTNRWSIPNREYIFDIWMLNLADESIQIIIDVNGVNKWSYNTSSTPALADKNLIKEGQIRFSGEFEPKNLSNMALELKGYKFDVGQYNLDDPLEEVDYSKEGAVTSRWGRQHGVAMYENGKTFCGPGQPINTTISAKSYHTKFDLTMKTPSANWFNMMLRQNSGELTQAADGKIDIGTRTGFELFTNDNGFQVYYNEADTRGDMLTWFAYDEAGCWSNAYREYTFEIWMLNLIDGSIQINIDVNGSSKLTFNTAGVTALEGKELVKEGQMRFVGDFNGSQTNMAIDIKGYPAEPLTKKVYELADTLTEWDVSKDNMIVSKWGNQQATVEYVDGVYTAQPGQPINGNVTMGSYHTKFDLNFVGDHPQVGKMWNMMLRQESGTREVLNPAIDTGARNGYELFTNSNGFQFFYNNMGNRTELSPKWVQFDEVNNFNNPDRTYTFEIWVLNLKDGSIQINVDVNEQLVLRYNSSADAAKIEEPIKTGTVRMCGQFDDLLGKGVKIKGYELNATECPFEIEGEIPSEVEVFEQPDFAGAKLVNNYRNFKVASALSGKANTRELGETDLELNVPGGKVESINVVAAPAGTEYSIKEGFKDNYLVGDEFANDLVLLKKKGEDVKEIALLQDEVSGFDSDTDGVKTLFISAGGQELQAEVGVWKYEISSSSKFSYLKDEIYVDGDFVLDAVCGQVVVHNDIEADDLEGWDTSALGPQQVKFTKFGKEFTQNIVVYTASIKDGYKSEYFVGQEYANDVIVVIDYGTVEEKVAPAEALVGFDTSTPGEKEVSIINSELKFTINVKVAQVSSISISGAKNQFTVGDKFETTGLVVKATYEDGKVLDVTSQATVDSSKVDMTKAGKYSVTVNCLGKTASYDVNVAEAPVTLLTISVSGARTEFKVGDTFESTGLKVIATYSDGSTKEVTADAKLNLEGVDMASEGKQTVGVEYQGKVATYVINVAAKSGGCGGSIAGGAIITLIAAAGVVIFAKKRKED